MRVIVVEERNYVRGQLLSEIWEITADEWRSWGIDSFIARMPQPNY